MTQLPHVMSDLIDLALDDLEKVERDKRYKVYMGCWHVDVDGLCLVCFAGAVMAMSLGMAPNQTTVRLDYIYDYHNRMALYALNQLRGGNVLAAAQILGITSPIPKQLHCVDIPYYADNRDAFHTAQRKLAADLREVGL